jgi:hypothetical protein
VKQPAQPQAFSFSPLGCGALSVPRKKRATRPGGRGEQRLPVDLALEHRQAVVVRAHAGAAVRRQEDRVAVVQQVVRGDGGGDAPFGASATYCAAAWW